MTDLCPDCGAAQKSEAEAPMGPPPTMLRAESMGAPNASGVSRPPAPPRPKRPAMFAFRPIFGGFALD
jgi:hypothetical protein